MTSVLLFLGVGLLAAPVFVGYAASVPLAILALGLIGSWAAGKARRRARPGRWAGLLALAIVGFLLGAVQMHRLVQAQLPESLAGDWSVVFEVTSIPVTHARGVTIFARLSAVDCATDEVGCLKLVGMPVRLQWYHPSEPVRAGQLWRAQLRLKRPRGFANPAGLDYHAWLLSQGVRATGYVRGVAHPVGETRNLAHLRARWARAVLDGQPLTNRRFFAALLFGDKSAVTGADWDLLKHTGTIHLMAISGLHVGFVSWLAFVLARAGLRIVALKYADLRLFHYLPLLCALLAAGGYSLIAGFSIPTLRAFCGCAVVCSLGLCNRRVSPMTALAAALALIGLLQPMAVLTTGFWLSFGAVAVLLWSFVGRRPRRAAGLLLAQMILFIGMLPLLLVAGQSVPLVSPLANLLAVPVVTFILVPGLFLGAACSGFEALQTLILGGLDQMMSALWWTLGKLADVSPVWTPARPAHGILSALLILSALALLAPAGLGVRIPAVAIFIACLFAPTRADYRLRLTVLDVGQGLAVVAQTPAHTWVFDVGARFSERFDAGSGILAPYLQQQGRRRVHLMVSHGDNDHAGGLEGLARHLTFARVLTGEPEPALEQHTSEPCKAGQHWFEDSVHYEVLWPPKPHSLEGNDASCVLLITLTVAGKQVRVLLPGDIGAAVEARLVPYLTMGVDVVVAPHHGSKTSSSAAFVQALRPSFVVFSTGYGNRYRHPNSKVVARYQAQGAMVLNTADQGAVTFEWRDDGQRQVAWVRGQRHRLWE